MGRYSDTFTFTNAFDADELRNTMDRILATSGTIFNSAPSPIVVHTYRPIPTKVIFNNPATIVYWSDDTKTVVKCGEDDTFDKEKGLALCYMKKWFSNKGNYNDTLKKWCGESEPSVYWIKGKEFYKCSKCGCEVMLPVLKCPRCESKIIEVRDGR